MPSGLIINKTTHIGWPEDIPWVQTWRPMLRTTVTKRERLVDHPPPSLSESKPRVCAGMVLLAQALNATGH